MSSSPGTNFLRLPRELRDMVYQWYLLSEDGYTYSPEAGKPQISDGLKIDLSLTYTCKQVAEEMKDMALATNTITFRTWLPDSGRNNAILLNAYLETLAKIQAWMLSVGHEFLTESKISQVEHQYPQSRPHLEAIRDRQPPKRQSWLEVEDFYKFALKVLSNESEFRDKVGDFHGTFDPTPICTFDFEAWKIPDDYDIAKFSEVLIPRLRTLRHSQDRCRQYRYSATAVAVRYLSNMPKDARLQLRSITLDEDRPSIAFPEGHGRGLVPFCLENKRLRITRKVNLWRNAFVAGSSPLWNVLASENIDRRLVDSQLPSKRITESLKDWVIKTVELPSQGMPAGAYTLELDGDPIAQKTSQVFEIVKRDAAWQIAFDRWAAISNTTWIQRRDHACFKFDSLPYIVRDLVENRPDSMVKCNFPVDDAWDADQVFNEGLDWTWRDWHKNWNNHRPREWQTSPPLLAWLNLLRDQVHFGRRENCLDGDVHGIFDFPPWFRNS